MKKARSAGRVKVNDLGRAPQTEVKLKKEVLVWGFRALAVFMGVDVSR